MSNVMIISHMLLIECLLLIIDTITFHQESCPGGNGEPLQLIITILL